METESQRTPEQIREHYEIEKQLSARLRGGNADERKRLYGESSWSTSTAP